MRLKNLLPVILILLILSSPAEPAETAGSREILFLGAPASSAGRGSTGVTGSGPELFYYNPASAAGADRTAFSLNYSTLPFQLDYSFPDISASFPTSYGVVGISVKGMLIGEPEDIDYGAGISVGMGKELTSSLSFGWGVNLLYGKKDTGMLYSGINLGAIYRFKMSRPGGRMGIFDPAFGISVNTGITSGKESDNIDRNSLTAGYSFTFFRGNGLDIKFFNEICGIDRYSEFPVKGGLEATVNNRYIISTGMIYPNYSDMTSASFGLGYRFSSPGISGSFNYSAVHYRDYSFLHYLGLNMVFNTEDRLPPETNIKPDYYFISPNDDGSQDYVTFNTVVNDDSTIKGWKLQIVDSENSVTREYNSAVREFSKRITTGELLSRIFRKKEAAVVPENVVWDGRDRGGLIVKDGLYTYRFNAWDSRDNISVVKSGKIIVDKVPPEIKISTDRKLISMTGTPSSKKIEITHKFKSAGTDTWDAGFMNAGGKAFKIYNWKGNIPEKVTWDGTGNNGIKVPEGNYTYYIRGADPAGNIVHAELKEIAVTGSPVTAELDLDISILSPRKIKEVVIRTGISEKSGLIKWSLDINSKSGKTVKSFTGSSMLPQVIRYNLTDSNGNMLKDGTYNLILTAEYKNEKIYRSPGRELIVDTTPPRLKVQHEPLLFSPDNDSIDDLLYIKTEWQEEFGIKRWVINIYPETGIIFKTFTGEGKIPKKLLWNGKNYKNELVESAADYFIELIAEDIAGNISKSSMDKIPVDILVLETGKGYKIDVNRIDFGYRTHQLLAKGVKVLDRIYEKIEKYRNYRVHVTGHTDDTGSEEESLVLSEKRAEAVMNYLTHKGIPGDNIEFTGMGETSSLFPNTSEENRRRNRRIEIRLEKNDD